MSGPTNHDRVETATPSVDIVIPCHNAAPTLERTLQSVLEQQLPANFRLSVFVVDDGSTDDTLAITARAGDDRVIPVRSDENRGRAAACNRGAAEGGAPVILLLDADCIFADRAAVSEHLRALENADVSIGAVRATGRGFWSRYQNGLRRAGHSRRPRILWTQTTANFAIRRRTFEAVGGFDVEFRHYGFEDKELLARLLNAGAVIDLNDSASVIHEDEVSLLGVCAKLQRAAQHSARHLMATAPSVYSQTPYAKLDARLHAWMRFLPTGPLVGAVNAAGGALQRLLGAESVPFAARRAVARACMALSYLHGTRLDATRERRGPTS